jgi:O-methyltransferase
MEKHLELFNAVVEGGMLDLNRAITLCHLLMQTAQIPGAVCEFGTFSGRTAALMASLTNKEVYLYDSFDGLPYPGPHDTNLTPFVKGSMAIPDGAGQIGVMFYAHGLKEPHIVVKEFRHLTVVDLPESISFCHVDGDLFESIKTVLNLVWPFVSSQGIILIDDYNHPELPGVKKAVNDFAKRLRLLVRQPFGINGQPSIHAYLQKP